MDACIQRVLRCFRRDFALALWRKAVDAALLPAAVIVMLAVCPVFFDLPQLHTIQMMLPPTYFIQGVYDLTMLIHCGIFVSCMLVLCALCVCFKYLIGIKLRGKIE